MFFARKALGATAALCSLLATGLMPGIVHAAPAQAERLTPDAQYAVRHIVDADDNGRLPFAVVDKRNARLFVYSPSGHLVGATTVLLGLARGDAATPGIGRLDPSQIPASERTTPSGRFLTEPGRIPSGEDNIWIDYDARLAIHRMRPSPRWQRRSQRLASATPRDNRISAGCVVVPVHFYEHVVKPMLGHGPGVVYVLPETRPVQAVFAELDAQL